MCIRKVVEKKMGIDFETTYNSVRREVSCNIHRGFRMPLQQATIVKICLNETYSKGRIFKQIYD